MDASARSKCLHLAALGNNFRFATPTGTGGTISTICEGPSTQLQCRGNQPCSLGHTCMHLITGCLLVTTINRPMAVITSLYYVLWNKWSMKGIMILQVTSTLHEHYILRIVLLERCEKLGRPRLRHQLYKDARWYPTARDIQHLTPFRLWITSLKLLTLPLSY
jgi:hypothetical protein